MPTGTIARAFSLIEKIAQFSAATPAGGFNAAIGARGWLDADRGLGLERVSALPRHSVAARSFLDGFGRQTSRISDSATRLH